MPQLRATTLDGSAERGVRLRNVLPLAKRRSGASVAGGIKSVTRVINGSTNFADTVHDKKQLTKALRRRLHDEAKVDLAGLLEFVFPPNLQHPLSSGRLYAFALYGPLNENNDLQSGFRGTHAVQPWELDSLCGSIQKEDILQVYVSESRPLCSLTDAERADIIAQADPKLKTGKREITAGEVEKLLRHLPGDAEGYLSFHDAQQKILEHRADQIRRAKIIFPNLTSGGTKGKASTTTRSPSSIPTSPLLAATATTTTHPRSLSLDGQRKSVLTSSAPNLLRPGYGIGGQVIEQESGRRRAKNSPCNQRRRRRVSSEVAPPSMFMFDIGLTSNQAANETNMLLSTRSFQLCNLSDGNNPGLVQNVRLVRQDPNKQDDGRAVWDRNSCTRGTYVGGSVRSTLSATTVKRKCVLY